jgi:hypothetical protein
MGGKLNRKNIEGTAQRKAEGDRKPAFFAKGKNKEEKGAKTEECGEGYRVAVKDFRNQIWSSYKGGKGDQGEHDLLSG